MDRVHQVFNLQCAHQYNQGNTSVRQRIQKLRALQKAIEHTYRQDIRDALFADFKKPQVEVDLTEIYPVISEIKYACNNLSDWICPQRVATPLSLIGSRSYIHHEPKGVCLIISPWNFPITLTFSPLVSAVAAGNTVIIKPSEHSPKSSEIMARIIQEVFQEEEVALFQGEVEVSQSLLQLPFNHIFFTGSPQVGKIVMSAAAKNLSSVTLELGGKSPTIVDSSADVKKAAKRIVWGKFLNNGQLCVSPDYIMVDATIKDEFIEYLKHYLNAYYSEDAADSSAYCRIINMKQFTRLESIIQDAKNNGVVLEHGGTTREEDRYIEPTLLSGTLDSTKVMKEEIFGPILPIISYSNTSEVIQYINSNPKPLALYIFSRKKSYIKNIIRNTRAGTTSINNTIIQFSNHNLPFGGSNNSGVGKSHGIFGFREFSNARSVLKQDISGINELLYPPYNKFKEKLAEFTVKWF